MHNEDWYPKVRKLLEEAERKNFLITFDDPDPIDAPDYDAPIEALEKQGYQVLVPTDGPATTIMCNTDKSIQIADIQTVLQPCFQNDEGTVIVAEIGNAALWPEKNTGQRKWQTLNS